MRQRRVPGELRGLLLELEDLSPLANEPFGWPRRRPATMLLGAFDALRFDFAFRDVCAGL